MQRISLHLSKCHIFGNHMSWLFFCSFLFLSAFFYFLLSMFLMKPKSTIYKSSFYIYTICQIYTVNIAKELHASGGAILAHIWAKNAFHHFVLIGLLEQYTKFKSKTFKLRFIFAMVYQKRTSKWAKKWKSEHFGTNLRHLTEKLT